MKRQQFRTKGHERKFNGGDVTARRSTENGRSDNGERF